MSSSSSSSSSSDEDFSYEGAQSLEVNLWDVAAATGGEKEEEMSSEEAEIDLEIELETVKRTGKKRKRRIRDDDDDDIDDGDRRKKRRKRNQLTRPERIQKRKKKRVNERKRLASLSQQNSPVTTTPVNVINIDDEDEDEFDDVDFVDPGVIHIPLRRSSQSVSGESLRKMKQLQLEEKIQERKMKRDLMEASRKKRTVRELKEDDILLDDDEDDDVVLKKKITLKIEGEEEEIIINFNPRRTVDYIKHRLIKLKEWHCSANEIVMKRKNEILMGTTTLSSLQDLRDQEVFVLSLPKGAKKKEDEFWRIKFVFKGQREPTELNINPKLTFKDVRTLISQEKNIRPASKIKLFFDDEPLQLKWVLEKSEVEEDDIIECKVS